MLPLWAINGKVNKELFFFQVPYDFIRKKRAIRVDDKTQGKITRQFRPVALDEAFRQFHGFLDEIHAQQRFTTEKSDVQIRLFLFYALLYRQRNRSFHDFVTHYGTALRMGFLVIAIATAEVTLFGYT